MNHILGLHIFYHHHICFLHVWNFWSIENLFGNFDKRKSTGVYLKYTLLKHCKADSAVWSSIWRCIHCYSHYRHHSPPSWVWYFMGICMVTCDNDCSCFRGNYPRNTMVRRRLAAELDLGTLVFVWASTLDSKKLVWKF